MEANPTLIINYFSGFKQNLVPLFQRPYTWGEKQWRTLWDDLLDFYDLAEGESRATHFMGAVVTMPARSVPVGVSKFLVIDGQQRLTTIALLMCAIRDALPQGDEVRKGKIQNFYLTNYGNPGLDFFKFLPTQGDREAYSPIIQNLSSAFPESQFKKAYEFFRRRLRDQVDEGMVVDGGKILHLVETRLMVVMINLSDNDDPYLIFESLNFKGSPLEQADLVRNYFLMRFAVTEQQSVYDTIWLPMQQRLGPNLTEFMRHFLGAEGEDVRKGDVYASIKRLVTDAENASVKLLMSRMERLSVLYSRIATANHEPNKALSVYFDRFRQLDFGTAYPLLLALYEDYEDGQFVEAEFLELLRILFSFIIRRMVVSVPSNSLSGMFVGLSKSKPITETPSAWLSLALSSEQRNRRWPSDEEFNQAWLRFDMYQSRRTCPVVLEALEASFEHHEPVNLGQTTIEHIMPQTLSGEWETMLGSEWASIHRDWLHTIGNLTLTGYNPELSNRSYLDKRAIYALSHFELNRYFASFESWGQPMISDRAQYLFDFALQLWPRPAYAAPPSVEPTKVNTAAFHPESVRRAEQHLQTHMSKVSQTKYESDARHLRLVCAVSGEHRETSGVPYYWFAFHRAQLEFLNAVNEAFVCLGCGSSESTLLIPLEVVKTNLQGFSVTKAENRHYWHIVIQRKDERFMLRLLGGTDGPDLTTYSLSTCALVS